MKSDFHQSHWREIEADRLARYEEMLVYRPQHEAMIAPLGIEPGHTVVDFGCGPGFVAEEFARRVGEHGKVFGLDINAQFVDRATIRARESHLSNIEYVHLPDDAVPLPDASADRLFCKNVLEYVPDAAATIAEQYRLLKPGGRIQLMDSDWGFVIVEPWGKAITDEFFKAAGGAFKEPLIGRKLYGLVCDAGFDSVEVRVAASPDTVGGGMPILVNMVSYIEAFGAMPTARTEELMSALRDAIDRRQFLFVLPQFIVTGVKPQ